MPSFTIDGNPGSVRSKASGMRTHAQTFTQTGDALATITTDGWISRSGDRFREKFETEPDRWRDAGAGWQRAATALDHFAGELERAQERAEWAEQEYARGEQVTRDARAAYDADVDRAQNEAAQKRAAGFTVDLTILPFHDPGEEVRQAALREYDSVEADLDTAAHDCATEVKAGCADAPEKRKWYEKVGGAVAGFFAGAGEALVDLGKLAYFLTMPHVAIPMMLMDDLNSGMTPEEIAAKYQLKLEDAKAIGEYAVNDPVGFGKTLGKAVLDWDTWADDPARAAGRLLPDAVIAVLTAGSGTAATRGAAATRNVVKGLDDLADVRHLDGVNRFDGPPAHMSEISGSTRRSLMDQMASPSYHSSNRDIIEGDHDILGGRGSTQEFLDEFAPRGPDGTREWDWDKAAPNDGAVPGSNRTLSPGEVPQLDRIGGDNGSYFGQDGDSMGSRSLPPDRLNFERTPWEVDRNHPDLTSGRVTIEESEVAPAFGQSGGGAQFRFVEHLDDGSTRVMNQGELRSGDNPIISVREAPQLRPDWGAGAAGGLGSHGTQSLERFLDDYMPREGGTP